MSRHLRSELSVRSEGVDPATHGRTAAFLRLPIASEAGSVPTVARREGLLLPDRALDVTRRARSCDEPLCVVTRGGIGVLTKQHRLQSDERAESHSPPAMRRGNLDSSPYRADQPSDTRPMSDDLGSPPQRSASGVLRECSGRWRRRAVLPPRSRHRQRRSPSVLTRSGREPARPRRAARA